MNGQVRALAAYIHGDRTALQDLEPGGDEFEVKIDLRSTDSVMSIAAPTAGGNAVPTGFAGKVAARMNEIRLSTKLGVQPIPGKGTTVNFPYEGADPNQFATTAEQDERTRRATNGTRPISARSRLRWSRKPKNLNSPRNC